MAGNDGDDEAEGHGQATKNASRTEPKQRKGPTLRDAFVQESKRRERKQAAKDAEDNSESDSSSKNKKKSKDFVPSSYLTDILSSVEEQMANWPWLYQDAAPKPVGMLAEVLNEDDEEEGEYGDDDEVDAAEKERQEVCVDPLCGACAVALLQTERGTERKRKVAKEGSKRK